MIEFKKTTYVWAIWFFGWDGGNWLACLLRQEGEKPELLYRYRYYHRDDKVFDSSDEKNWFRVAARSDDEEEVSKIERLTDESARLGAGHFGTTFQKIDVHGDGDAAAELLMKSPWAYTRSVTRAFDATTPDDRGPDGRGPRRWKHYVCGEPEWRRIQAADPGNKDYDPVLVDNAVLANRCCAGCGFPMMDPESRTRKPR